MNQLIKAGNIKQANKLPYGYNECWDGSFTVKIRMRNEAFQHLKLHELVAETLYVTEVSQKNCVTLYGQVSQFGKLVLQIAIAAALSKRNNW